MSQFGVRLSPRDDRDYSISDMAIKVPMLPMEVDWSHKVHIRDQGFWGTCVGKAGAGLMSAILGKKLSSLFLYTRCKQLDGIPNEEGTYVRTALRVMQREGVCLDETLPYHYLTNHDRLPALTEEMFHEASDYQIEAYARIDSIQEIEEALANGFLVIAVIMVGDNFIYYNGGVLGIPEGNLHGLHAVIITGYNKYTGVVKGRGANSWGESWGEDGFFRMSYDYLRNSLWCPELWAVEIIEDKDFLDLEEGGDSMFPSFWKEPAFWKIVVTAIFATLTEVFGLAIPAEVFWGLIALMGTWIFKEAWEQTAVRVAMIKEVGYAATVKQLKGK